ncbi:PucR family transcriptional regulator [Streptomyces ovatisporus]|uniref:PucR family transcriptional regulator n=1 Tax=Streptomyces ovatisporus TaxID=1128682 RepID=A0ABV9A3V9_9ACTN
MAGIGPEGEPGGRANQSGGSGAGTGAAADGGDGREDEDFVGDYPRLLAEVSQTGRLLRRDELDGFRALGERAAERGLHLRELVGLYLGQTRRLWGELPGVARAGTAGERARTGDALLGAVEAAVSALGEGHEHAQRLAMRQEENERREFVDDLLYGRSDMGRLAERAQRFGLRLAGVHAVAVAAGSERYDDVHRTVRRIERELLGRFGARDVLLATKDGRLVCIASSNDRDVLDHFAKLAEHPGAGYPAAERVAVGREHSGAGGVVRSYEEALGTLELAGQLGLEGVRLSASELLVFPVLLRDRAAMADLVGTVLGPLTKARGGAAPLLETLSVCAAAGYVNAEAARRLGLSVRTLSYRLERIRTLTGYSPAEPLQRFTLEAAVMGARLLGWPENEL